MGIALAEDYEGPMNLAPMERARRHYEDMALAARLNAAVPQALVPATVVIKENIKHLSTADVQELALLFEAEYIERLAVDRGGKDAPSYNIQW